MRCFVPLLATLGLGLTIAAFMLRGGGSAWTIMRMDFWGDGFCGANPTSQKKVRFVHQMPWQQHFVTNMFIRPETSKEIEVPLRQLDPTSLVLRRV